MKGIWNRLRLALLGGILAFAGAGIVSPLAGGVVAEAAGAEETITLVGINNTSSGDTYAQKTDGTWNTEYVYGSVLNGSGNPDSYDKNAYIRHQGGYTLTLGVTSAQLVSVKLISDSANKGDYGLLTLISCTGTSVSGGYLLTPQEGAVEIKATHPSGNTMLRYTAEVTYVPETVEIGDIVSIKVDNTPDKVEYHVGEANSLSGLVISGTDANGQSVRISLDDPGLVVEPADGYVFGLNDITAAEGKGARISYTNGAGTVLELSDAWTYYVADAPALEYVADQDHFNKSAGTAAIGDLTWSFHLNGGSIYAGTSAKGTQFGSSGTPSSEMRLRSPLFIGAGKSLVSEVTVNASTGNGASANLSVYVGGEHLGTHKLTTSAMDYSFPLSAGKVGHIEIVYTPASGSDLGAAVYLKSISISASAVVENGDSTAIAALTKLEAVDGCAYSTPEEISNLESIVNEYDSLCADYPPFAAAMLDDYESGDVSHANGIQKDYVSAGEKAESIRGRITTPEAQPFFSFQGDGNDGMNWAIAGASLGIAFLGAAGYLFYRKKRAVR